MKAMNYQCLIEDRDEILEKTLTMAYTVKYLMAEYILVTQSCCYRVMLLKSTKHLQDLHIWRCSNCYRTRSLRRNTYYEKHRRINLQVIKDLLTLLSTGIKFTYLTFITLYSTFSHSHKYFLTSLSINNKTSR